MSEQFDADYFLRGKETGKSLYENYRWLPDLTIPMAQRVVDHCGMEKGCKILDFGCARGYLVKALRGLGFDAYGMDVSRWAIANCDPDVRRYCFMNDAVGKGCPAEFDWIIAKDVLEHCEYIDTVTYSLMDMAKIGIFVVVPLSYTDNTGTSYVIEEYEKDVTHIQRHTLPYWISLFLKPGWSVQASYRVPGVKDNYSKYEYGNGFIKVQRLGTD